MSELIISEIWVYPVKSLAGIPLESSRVLPKGLLHDRRWMLVDENNTAITQRVYPQMALFKVQLNKDGISIHYNGEEIEVSNDDQTSSLTARIWNDTVDVVEVSPDHNAWFSARLGINCKLVKFPEANRRPVEARFSMNDEQVSLADAYPLLVIGQASLDDLNSRMPVDLPMNRFRPNIVFTGGEPYEEDLWTNFHAGSGEFRGARPSARCVLTTVDQETAIKGSEPLVTLAKYRRVDNHIYFGQNCLVRKTGTIRVGDRIIPG